MFYGGLQWNLHRLHVYSSVPHVNRGDTLESGWIHLKVGIQYVLFLVGLDWAAKVIAHIFILSVLLASSVDWPWWWAKPVLSGLRSLSLGRQKVFFWTDPMKFLFVWREIKFKNWYFKWNFPNLEVADVTRPDQT